MSKIDYSKYLKNCSKKNSNYKIYGYSAKCLNESIEFDYDSIGICPVCGNRCFADSICCVCGNEPCAQTISELQAVREWYARELEVNPDYKYKVDLHENN